MVSAGRHDVHIQVSMKDLCSSPLIDLFSLDNTIVGRC
jgi:hypothetical protein